MTSRSILALWFVVTILQTGLVCAQQPAQDEGTLKAAVVADVTQAARIARVDFTDSLVYDFLETWSTQSTAVGEVYKAVPQDTRVNRLATYLGAKGSMVKVEDLSKLDLGDFNWGYIKRDLKYAPMRLETYKGAKLTGVELQGEHFDVSVDQGKMILLPIDGKATEARVTAVFDTGTMKSLWTGSPGVGNIKVTSSSTTKGCEIVVNSTPQKATVLFNRREWYERTNTSTVRESGLWEVTVKLPGYKDWRAQRPLAPGDSWTIEAVLAKQ